MDLITNEQGKNLIELCIESKLRILNGRVVGDYLGSYTFHNSLGKSSIDYVITSEDIVNSFAFLNVLPPNELSDHCIVWFSLKCDQNIKKHPHDNITTYQIPGKFCLDSDSKLKYTTALQSEEMKRNIELFMLEVNNPDGNVNELTEKLTNIMLTTAKKSLKFKSYKKKRKKKHEWFNGNCFFMRRELRNLGKRMHQNPNNLSIKTSFHKLLKEFKKNC